MNYVLDRFEGDFALFVGDDENILKLNKQDFLAYREGDVFTLESERLIFIKELTDLRRESVRNRFKKLRRG
ncbi:MAG TPA: DUF3006 domain-containing protein [Firmicutes bacterium]|nr:DUF3006 domain-containing protein [Bacillota bacterium]